jgi:hypothetical protein
MTISHLDHSLMWRSLSPAIRRRIQPYPSSSGCTGWVLAPKIS